MSPKHSLKIKGAPLKKRFNVLLRADEPDLAKALAPKLHLTKLNIKGTTDYSVNEVLRECLHYTAKQFGVE